MAVWWIHHAVLLRPRDDGAPMRRRPPSPGRCRHTRVLLDLLLRSAATLVLLGWRPVAGAVEPGNTPRASLETFLQTAHRGRWDELHDWIGHPSSAAATERTLQQLTAVLDAHLPEAVRQSSNDPGGRTDDGLGAEQEEVGRVPGPDGSTEPFRLRRVDARWIFSSDTVRAADDWYAELPDRWVRDRVPRWWLRPGPRGLGRWQWALLIPLLVGCWWVGRAGSALLREGVTRALQQRGVAVDQLWTRRLRSPLTLLLAAEAGRTIPWVLRTPSAGETFVDGLVAAAQLAGLFWSLVRLIDIGEDVVRASPFARGRNELLGMLPLVARMLKVTLTVLAGVLGLQQLGYPVQGLLAGLGIGGVALAFGAQKTVENVFGSVTLGVDQPFRIGDLVRVDDVLGTVESIGLRSTRIRTPQQTVVTLPNGRLADSRIENLAGRQHWRWNGSVWLGHSSPPQRVHRLVETLEEAIRAHPGVIADSVRIHLASVTPQGLELEFDALTVAADWESFRRLRQTLLIDLLQRIHDSECLLVATTPVVPPPPPAGRGRPRDA